MNAAKLRSYLECPVCLMLPRIKIFVCTNGHKICESCYNKLKGGEAAKACPQGGCTYDRPPRRARDAEAMIENSNFNHSCRMPGCLVEVKKDKLCAHEISCIFRKVPCPGCDKEVQYKALNSHIKKSHEDSVVIDSTFIALLNEDTISKTNQTWVLFIHREAGFEFYPTLVIKDGLWYFWIKMKADQLSVASWSYHAKSENVEHGMLVEFSGSVQTVDLGMDKVIETGQHMVLSKHNVKKLKANSTNAEYPHKLTIKFKLFKK